MRSASSFHPSVAPKEKRSRYGSPNQRRRVIGGIRIIALDVRRLPFLSAGIRSHLRLFDNVPELFSFFESSVPGLFFVARSTASGRVLRFLWRGVHRRSSVIYLAWTFRLTKR
jgi:hypothetical protein